VAARAPAAFGPDGTSSGPPTRPYEVLALTWAPPCATSGRPGAASRVDRHAFRSLGVRQATTRTLPTLPSRARHSAPSPPLVDAAGPCHMLAHRCGPLLAQVPLAPVVVVVVGVIAAVVVVQVVSSAWTFSLRDGLVVVVVVVVVASSSSSASSRCHRRRCCRSHLSSPSLSS